MPLRKSFRAVIPIAMFRYLDLGHVQWQHGLLHTIMHPSWVGVRNDYTKSGTICRNSVDYIRCSQPFVRQALECGILSLPKHSCTCTCNPDASLLATYASLKSPLPSRYIAEMQGVINLLRVSESCYLSAFLGLLSSLRAETDHATRNVKLLDILIGPCQSLLSSDPKV